MPSTVPEDFLHVVAGVIHDPVNEDRVLISRRHAESHQGGKWEFPGGKVEPDEHPAAALKRELYEELGIVVRQAQPFIRINHVYADRAVHLDVWNISEYENEPAGREGQQIKWASIEHLHDYDYPLANIPVIRALQLPAVYAISAAKRMGQDDFIQYLERALRHGLGLLQLREPDLDVNEYRKLAHIVISMCHEYGARVVLNNDTGLVQDLGADGVQLNSRVLMQLNERPLAEDKLVIASCHDSRELHQAEAVNADAVLLSPVLDTPSHPGAITLGWKKFQQLAGQCAIPVYALGGMNPDSLQQARNHGAIGIAMITAFWDQYRD